MRLKPLFLVFLIGLLVIAPFMMEEVKAQEENGSFGNPIVPDIAFVNWTKFWKLFNTYSDWNLEYNDGSGWANIKSDLQVIKNYTVLTDEGWISVNKTEATTCKITLNFTASYNADYRLTFGVSLDVKNYTYKTDSWNYTISYKNYTVVFDWSDIKEIPNLIVSHGVKLVEDESWFWFRIRKDNVQEGKNIIIDPSFGYDVKGGTKTSYKDKITQTIFTCSEIGTATTITMYLEQWASYYPKVSFVIYKDSDNSLVGYTAEWTVTDAWDGWKTLNIVWGGSLEATDYKLGIWMDDYIYVFRTTGATSYYDNIVYDYPNFPNPVVEDAGPYDRQYSIYCNYTVAEEEEKSFTLEETLTITSNVYEYKEKLFTQTDTMTISSALKVFQEKLFISQGTIKITDSMESLLEKIIVLFEFQETILIVPTLGFTITEVTTLQEVLALAAIAFILAVVAITLALCSMK